MGTERAFAASKYTMECRHFAKRLRESPRRELGNDDSSDDASYQNKCYESSRPQLGPASSQRRLGLLCDIPDLLNLVSALDHLARCHLTAADSRCEPN